MFKALAKKAAAGVAGGEPLPEARAAAEPVPAVPKYMADLESENPMKRLQVTIIRLHGGVCRVECEKGAKKQQRTHTNTHTNTQTHARTHTQLVGSYPQTL